MSSGSQLQPPLLAWRGLAFATRASFERKLEGLYGAETDERAFDALAVDKQQALLIINRRFVELDLWVAVRRIKNVYGRGGVGMNFEAWPFLESTLRRRKDFTSRLAAHRDAKVGFIECGLRRASLHILHHAKGRPPSWSAHFDLYNPWASPFDAVRHLFYEKFRGRTPDWRVIRDSLWSEPRARGLIRR